MLSLKPFMQLNLCFYESDSGQNRVSLISLLLQNFHPIGAYSAKYANASLPEQAFHSDGFDVADCIM